MLDSERISTIVKESGQSKIDFARGLRPNANPQWIYDIFSGKTGISKEVSHLIVDKYPQYNIAWVCLGVGEKYAAAETLSQPKVSESIRAAGDNDTPENIIELLGRILKNQEKEFANLKTILDGVEKAQSRLEGKFGVSAGAGQIPKSDELNAIALRNPSRKGAAGKK